MNVLLKIIGIIIIFCTIVLDSVFIFNEKITFLRIFGTILIFILLISGILIHAINKNSTLILLKWISILILYKTLVDILFHYNEPYSTLFMVLKTILIVLLLPAFECLYQRNFNIEKWIFFIALIPIIFGFFQIFDKTFILADLLNIKHIGIYGESSSYIKRAERIIGTYNIAIGFALLLGFLFIIAFSNFIENKRKILYFPMMIIFLILMLFTQTRSGIYGLFPSIFISYIIVKKTSLKRVIFYSVIILTCFLTFSQIKEIIGNYSERSAQFVDVNTYVKISSNIWGVYGALKASPLIGVSKKELSKAVDNGKKEIGEVIDYKNRYNHTDPVYHNLFAEYLQHYGLIGFFLLIIVFLKIFKKIKNKENPFVRIKLYAILIYFIQFSMMHNNKLLLTAIIWIMLSVGNEKEEEFICNRLNFEQASQNI
jgi:O-antigen ligase